MGRWGCGFWSRSRRAAAGAATLALAACASGPPPTLYDLTAAKPPSARALRAQIRIGQPSATADLDSASILVRESPLTLATLADASWPEALPGLFRARLAQSFQNAGLARSIDGPAANADYEVDLDIRAFEFDAETKEAHLDIAAWVVALGSGRIVADEIFTLRAPVASTNAADVAAALDGAASTVMTEIVRFVAKAL
jgi:cholesterol transport system auxiliary component